MRTRSDRGYSLAGLGATEEFLVDLAGKQVGTGLKLRSWGLSGQAAFKGSQVFGNKRVLDASVHLSKNSLGNTRMVLGVYIRSGRSYESWGMSHSGVQ